MNLQDVTGRLVVFVALAAFGALVFLLARLASHGAFSPTPERTEVAESVGARAEGDARDDDPVRP